MLQPGEVIRADVLRDLGDGQWVLGLLGVEIAFPSLVPLQVGSTITLGVEASPGGPSRLRLLEPNPKASPKVADTKSRKSSSKRGCIDFRV